VAARTPTEERLSRIWEQVLAVKGIGVRDNYFDLGGDSITAIQIVARAEEAGVHFEVHDLFAELTVEGLARVVDGAASPVPAPAGDASLPEISSTEMDALAAALQQLDGPRD
jgi:aryl carrier-like protein